MADIPGLIAGAHDGAGLGDQFLRHIERTAVLVHLVDLAPLEGDPLEHYRTIRAELAGYAPTLATKREIVAGNKLDLTGARDNLDALRDALDVPVLGISAATGAGLSELNETIWKALHHDSQPQPTR
jgi:GTP-binding protein